jgi:uncharacterized MAPEG superfamily protein
MKPQPRTTVLLKVILHPKHDDRRGSMSSLGRGDGPRTSRRISLPRANAIRVLRLRMVAVKKFDEAAAGAFALGCDRGRQHFEPGSDQRRRRYDLAHRNDLETILPFLASAFLAAISGAVTYRAALWLFVPFTSRARSPHRRVRVWITTVAIYLNRHRRHHVARHNHLAVESSNVGT